ncbi:lasso RiPP family leader peptide-containing protein [Cellulosimicrobium arenosum]|uniref:Lasso RiPP family leader peptide-containing protein n=1 Tax=Cellulosimicrobium arenosum TaxID=2708133 RepID=A0A927G8K2_9MICO|nr:lasso RiPP family leader peptide-containing protein [Cellulosimicrobium arenosum]MBD8078932.1 lasso RiPP family leader peptide-containing protein [Cellulosimicrobium arenosum]
MAYEAPKISRVGSVRGLTLGWDTWREYQDEAYFYGHKIPLPGSGDDDGSDLS